MNPDLLREALQAALKWMGITFDQKRADGMHMLRHSCGSIVYRQTAGDVKQTQAWLGHSNSRVTLDTYTHLSDNEKQGPHSGSKLRFLLPQRLALCTKSLKLCAGDSPRVAQKGLIYYAESSYRSGG